MRLCPICKDEVSGIKVSSDDFISYCHECERIVEGETIDSEELELESQLQQIWNQLDHDEQAIKEFCNAG